MRYSVAIVLLIILIYLTSYSYREDYIHQLKLNQIPCHREIPENVQHISIKDRLAIERIIEQYMKKRKMNKSHCKKIISSIRDGMIRGALGGLVMAGSEGVVSGAVVFGLLNGVMTGWSFRVHDNSFMLDHKHK